MTDFPGPGVYPNHEIQDDRYFRIPAASKSALWRIHLMPPTVRTLDQARAWIVGPKPTYAMILGRAFDDAMQYGDAWREKWLAGPTNPKTGKGFGGDTQKFAAFVSDYGETCLVPEDMDRIDKMRQAVYDHPDARSLLAFPDAIFQVVVIWDDERTGARCKGKIDLWSVRQGVSVHVDFKTWTKRRQHVPSELAFAWECEDRGYDLQAAHYLDGPATLDRSKGIEPHHREFTIIAIEKDPYVIESTGEELYGVSVLDFEPAQLEGSLRVRDELLTAWCAIQDGTWKPPKLGTQKIRLANHREDHYANRPETT